MDLPRSLLFAAGILIASGGSALPADAQAPDNTAPPATVAPPITGPDGEVIHSWALAPAGDPNTATRATLSYSLDPAATVTDAVTLYNFSNVDLTFRIYATDAFNSPDDGGLALLPGDQQATDVGTWVKPDVDFVTVPAGQQATMPFTITVPADATPGDHVGALLASNQAISNNTQNTSVLLDRRTGSVMYVRVNGPIVPKIGIQDLAASYKPALNPFDGSVDVSYKVVNSGNVRLDAATIVSVAGPLGVAETALPRNDLPELLPGQSVNVTQKVDGISGLGVIETTVQLVPGDGESGKDVTPSTASTRTFAPPVTLLLLLLIIGFLLLAVRAIRKRRRPAPPLQPVRQPEPQRT